ncbi:hypothetical protein MAPG_09256 [Magnaporthiopsis poae ATCC 64411]|uniref:Ariadne RING finger n=1 Tax=Magnaporthiopsis poae (strain ATCC 64411 / 73-15) TaxID=644358 RepID=A0A0C4E9H1_MAGP6|nr:hypothetical protein MAPG_09256 [Magnaporthiopsis poae ATCC 64411]
MERSIPIRPARAQCHFFASGRCMKGASCPFSHAIDQESPSPSARPLRNTTTAPPASLKSPATICRFFQAGKCHKGDECVFLHEETAKPVLVVERTFTKPGAPAPETLPATADSRSLVPCRFFTAGGCKNGSSCPFMHDPAAQEAGLPTDPTPNITLSEVTESLVDDPQDDWTRAFSGAVVKFADGASVDDLSLASDFSAVRLDNLPPGSTPVSVTRLIGGLGFTASDDCVRVRQAADGKTASADVKVKDPSFAGAVRDKLSKGSSGIRAARIDVPMATGSGLHRVDCCKVLCSWHRATRTVWLNFRTEKVAQKVCGGFQSGAFKVKNQAVNASNPTGSNNRYSSNDQAWTVRLSNLDPAVTKTDIITPIPGRWMPTHVELGEPTYTEYANTVASTVKARLLQIGPLDMWSVAETGSGKRVKAQARFENEEDAKTAESTLNNKSVAWLRGDMMALRSPSKSAAKLTVQHVTVAKIKLTARIFNTLREPLNARREQWSEKGVHFVAYPPSNGHVVLKLEGAETKNVAEAYRTLSVMIEGTKLDVGKDAWCTIIQNHAFWRDILERIDKDHGVTAIRDRRRCQLRLFGSTEGCELAGRLITAQLEKRVSEASVVIELASDQFQWACRGGFKELVTELGADKVTLDVISNPKRILCSANDHAKIRALLANKNEPPPSGNPQSKDTPAGSRDCSVCWTEAEEPVVVTSCGHAYCAGCFADLCSAEPTAGSQYVVACVGDAAACKKTLPLAELKEHLSSAEFEDVLKAAFTSHVRRHPSDFSYCPSPDCERIYRIANADSSAAIFTCPECFEATCTSCQAPSHPGFTCAERKDMATGGYEALARVKAELGIKDCPKCKTAMEKTEGCNHMTCRGCGAHICWVCMATFDSAQKCYNHLSAKHGGIFDVPAGIL